MELPTKKDYERFVENFTKKLQEKDTDLCFYTFGSLEDGNCDYGRSDIDGDIILNSEVITPKEKILSVAESLAEVSKETKVKTQFNLLDRQTSIEGRFLSYTKDYTDFIKERARVRYGKDYKSGVLYSAAFNFSGPSGVRNTLLYSIQYFNINKDMFIEKASKSLEKVSKFPKKLIWLRKGVIVPSKSVAKRELENILKDIDLNSLGNINNLLSNPEKLYARLSNQYIALSLLAESLECMERMIGSYLRNFPTVNERELKE